MARPNRAKDAVGVEGSPPPPEIDRATLLRCRTQDHIAFQAFVARLLAMTTSASDLEKDLEPTFGPDEARRIAFGDTPWSCALQFERPESNGVLRSLGQGSQ
jgi:hypothetical protein